MSKDKELDRIEKHFGDKYWCSLRTGYNGIALTNPDGSSRLSAEEKRMKDYYDKNSSDRKR
ncbi:hypothetical protein ACFLZZ_00225 [Nanoarchaeota archaeon]